MPSHRFSSRRVSPRLMPDSLVNPPTAYVHRKTGTDPNSRLWNWCLFECIRTEMAKGSPGEYNSEAGLEPVQKLQTGEPNHERSSLYRIRRPQEKHQLLHQAGGRHAGRRRQGESDTGRFAAV